MARTAGRCKRAGTAAGATSLRDWRCGLRLSTVDAGGVATSRTHLCATPSGSISTLVLWSSLAAPMFGCRSTSVGHALFPNRSGGSLVPPLATDLPALAPEIPTCIVSHAQNATIDAWFYARQPIFARTFYFGLNPPSVLEHISLTARARAAQWTGVLAMVLVAFLAESLILFASSTLYGACVSSAAPLMMTVTPKI